MPYDISILYIEDDIDIAEEVAYFLEKKVSTLYLADNGEDGLQMFREKSPDIIITDIQMPKMNGLDMVKLIREENSDIPIIIVSAFNESDKLLTAINLGVDSYLLKPLNMLELDKKIQKLTKPILLDKELADSKLQLSFMEKIKEQDKELLAYKERMEFAFYGSNDGLWDWDIVTNAAYLSPRWKAIIGYEDSEIENHISSWEKSVYPDDIAIAKEELNKVFSKEKKLYEVEFRQVHKDGHLVWVLARGVVKFDDNEKPIRMIGTHTDITDKKEVQDKLMQSQHSLAKAQEIAHIGSWKWEVGENNIEWSDEVFAILGEKVQSFKPDLEIFLSYIADDDREEVKQKIEMSVKDKSIPYDIHHQVLRKDGVKRYMHTMADIKYDADGKPFCMIGTIQDVTELKEVQLKLQKLAVTDELTKLYNRRYFNEIIVKELNRTKRDKHNIAFLMIDIDYFKFYNDKYGHIMGDTVLVKVSQVLKEFTNRAGDYAFRLGGEEFGVLFLADTIQSAKEYAQNLIKAIENLHIEHEKNKVSEVITASGGLVLKEYDHSLSVNDLYRRADKALYKAKDSGRNQIWINSDER